MRRGLQANDPNWPHFQPKETSVGALHRETRGFEPDVKWVLPTPWGPCSWTLHGDDNAEVVVTENMLPAPTARK